MKRIAIAMAHASLIPDHLHGDSDDPKQRWDQTVGNCLLIVNQALRWDMDPFAVAPETYVVRGKLGFQGKLVAAVVHGRGNLKGRLGYSFTGEGDGRTVTVAGLFADETEPRTITLTVGQAKTFDKNGKLMPMWKTDPDQKLVYSGVTKWARRHCPELMLGVLTVDDLDRMQVNRLDGAGVAGHLEQARELRESKPLLNALPGQPEAPQTAPEPPPGPIGGNGTTTAAEPEAPQTAPEPPETLSPPVDAADLEVQYLRAIESQTMIRPTNQLESAIQDDPDLDMEAKERLRVACVVHCDLIRSKRGMGTAPREG
jgi:hypothetical protein